MANNTFIASVFVTALISTVAARRRRHRRQRSGCCRDPSDMFDIFGGCVDNLPYIKHVTREVGATTTIGACRGAICRLRRADRSEVKGQSSAAPLDAREIILIVFEMTHASQSATRTPPLQ